MFVRLALVIGVVSQALSASDFSPGLFSNQSTGSMRELNRQTLDRQIRSFLLKEPQPPARNPLPPLQRDPLLNGHAAIRPSSLCAIPLTEMKVDHAKEFTVKSWKTPPASFDAIAKTSPIPACKD